MRILEQVHVAGRGPLKAILKAIDSYARTNPEGFPSITDLAANAGFSVRTIQRGIRELEARRLLAITHRTRKNGSDSTSAYAINWATLLDMAQPLPIPDGTLALPDGGVSPCHRGVSPCHPPGVTVSPPPISAHLKRKSKRHGAAVANGSRNETNEVSREEKTKGGWGRQLTGPELRHAPTVLALYETAAARGWIGRTERDRLNFFALCRACAIKGKNPGAYLTDCLRKKRFNLIRQEDEEAARRAIHQLIHKPPTARVSSLDDELEEENAHRLHRDATVARLRQLSAH